MSNKVFEGLDTFYTGTEYNTGTGVLSVFNEDKSNSFELTVINQVDYSDITGKPEVYLEEGEPSTTLAEDSVYIDSLTGSVWSGTSVGNIKMRDPDVGGLLLDKFENVGEDYTNKIVRADDGNLYTQIVENVTTTPTEIKLVSTPILDTNADTFHRVAFDTLTISSIFYHDRDTVGIVDESASTIYSYNSEERRLAIISLDDTRTPINGTYINIVGNTMGLVGVPYSFTLGEGAVVKPYYDAIVVLDNANLYVLEPAGDVTLHVETASLLEPILYDIDTSKFMYIDGLLVFFSISTNKYYVLDLITREIVDNTTSFDIAGKEAVLLDNGYIYFKQDTSRMYGFYALEISWKRVGIDDILPSKFCNSLKLTDVVSADSNVISHIKNANGTSIISEITAFNGFIYLTESNSPNVVTRVAGITTMKTSPRQSSDVLPFEVIGLAPFNNKLAVAIAGNVIRILDANSLAFEDSYDMSDLVTGDIISISSLPNHLYVLTNSNTLYVFDELDGSNPISTYVLDINGGFSKVCVLNHASLILTDIGGSATGLYEMRIGKTDNVQISPRIIIQNSTYPSVFKYLEKLAVMNGTINTDISMYNLHTELRRI